MRNFNKKLAATGAAAALMAAIGAAWAQTDASTDPADSTVTVTANQANTSGVRIIRFNDEGNSPESDPAAHLLLIKESAPRPMPVAQTTETTTTTTTVAAAQPSPAPAPIDAAPQPAADTSAPTPVGAMPPPRADRN